MTNNNPHFSNEITLGNILTIISFIFIVITGWFNTDKRLTLLERATQDNSLMIHTLVENQAISTRTYDRVSFIVDELLKRMKEQKDRTASK